MEERKYKIKFIIIVLVLTVISAILGASYALLIWHSQNNTELTVKIGDVAGVYFETGPNIDVSNLGPVFDYEKDGVSTYFTVSNYVDKNLYLDAYFNITSITDNLKEESFKYVIMQSSDNINYTKVKEDNFVNVNSGDTINIFNELILPANATISYKIILYIDGNMLNPTSMQNGSLNGVISVNERIVSPIINNVTSSVSTNSITLNINASDDKDDIKTYYCSSDNGNTFVESTTNTCTLNDLNTNTTYDVKVYAEDSDGNISEYYVTSIKTSDYSYLYYSYVDGSNSNSDFPHGDGYLYSYDLLTNKNTKILNLDSSFEVGGLTIKDDYLYYIQMDTNYSSSGYGSGYLYSYNLSTGQDKEILNLDNVTSVGGLALY